MVYKREKSVSPPAASAKQNSEKAEDDNDDGPKNISVHEMDLSTSKHDNTFHRSQTGDCELIAQPGDLNLTALDNGTKEDDSKFLDDSYLCELPF